MHICPKCNSTRVIKKGYTHLTNGITNQRFKCNSCLANFSRPFEDSATQELFDESVDGEEILDENPVIDFRYDRSDEWLEKNVFSKKRLIITSAQNNTVVSMGFMNAIKTFMEHNDANLIAIPIKYKTVNSMDDDTVTAYDDNIVPYLCENTIAFPKYNLKVYAGLRIQATAENPLSGLDPLSKGWSIIVGHAQVQLKTLPNINKRISDIITTTGAITEKKYSRTKLGEKAQFNHSLSAVLIEFDDSHYHIRHLNYDEDTKSFWDLDKCYSADGEVTKDRIEAIVTGDEHVVFRDIGVSDFTYFDPYSMVNVLRPKYIVRHDVLDSYSISHHHKKNVFTTYAKWKSNKNSIESEIKQTVDYINETTPDDSVSLIVQSNHNEHLLRWLNEVDIRTEPWNAKIYHYLMWNILEKTEMGPSGTQHPDPFELICRGWLNDNVQFVDRSGAKILGIEVGSHGDIGVNGARGSAKSFARIPDKMIVGHSHSPSIEKGCYTVGTSSKLSLEYNRGASSWHHAHVIIHKNGKRQMVFITPSGWRL